MTPQKPARRFTTLLLAACGLALLPALTPAAAQAEDAERFLAIAGNLIGAANDPAVRSLVRDSLWQDADTARYGLKLDDNWQQVAAASPKLPLVILIHGLNSNPTHNAPVLVPIRAAGFPVAVFAYPNDWDLTDSATFLSKTLKEFAAANPNVRLALVTHSMGGLVARACAEDPALDPGNVSRLVMIAPPSQGSLIAKVSFAADLWEHGIARSDGSLWDRMRDSIVDGLGEASNDLVPGSPFLTRLNARPRNANIRYAIFLGTHTAVTPVEFDTLRWAVTKAARGEGLEQVAQSADEFVADMDELVDGKGDGVVALKRGRLEGVDDVVLLPFDHLSCTGEPGDNEAIGTLQTEVLARLR